MEAPLGLGVVAGAGLETSTGWFLTNATSGKASTLSYIETIKTV